MALNVASPPPPPLFDDEDDFGEFEFIATPSSLPPLHTNGYNLNHHHRHQPPVAGGTPGDDEWGDFVDSPLQFHPSMASSPLSNGQSPPTPPPLSFFPFPDSNPGPIRSEATIPNSSKSWEKASGAIPLSVFGEEEAEEELDSLSARSPASSFDVVLSSSKVPARNDSGFGPGEGIKDLIVGLYGEVDKVGNAVNNNGVASDPDDRDGDDDFDESSWEFKDALSESFSGDPSVGGLQVFGNRWEYTQSPTIPSRDQNNEQDRVDTFPAHRSLENGFDDVVRQNGCSSVLDYEFGKVKAEYASSSNLANGHSVLDGNFWDLKDEVSETGFTDGQQVKQMVADQSGITANLFTSSAKLQDTGRLWDNYLGDLTDSTSISGKQDPDLSEAQEGISCDFSYENSESKNLNSGSVNALNDLISNLYDAVDPTQIPNKDGQDSADFVINAHIVKDDHHPNANQGVLKHAITDQNSTSFMIDALYDISAKLTLESFLDFYTRVKDSSRIVALYHLDNLKKAHQNAVLCGENLKAEDIDQEIRDAYAKLQLDGEAYMEERPPKDVAVDELLQVRQDPCFQALEKEYHLSEKLSLAVKNLSSSVWLCEHAISVLHILTIASLEEQRAYIIAWSKLVFTCAKELQNGAMIWSQSLQANVHTQILSEFQGCQYFIALGEIYRVTEVLKASFTLYKPWMILNPVDSMDILSSLEKCTSAWMDSGLRNALESISDLMGLEHKSSIKALLESIKSIHDLTFIGLQRSDSRCDESICRLSLLPLSTLQGMEAVVWCGGHYFLKLANLWANSVSPDPPQLPELHVGPSLKRSLEKH